MKISLLFFALTGTSTSTTASAFEFDSFKKSHRELQECPDPASTVACTMEEDPVKCGLSACQYSNICLAGAAGFTPSRCWPAVCRDASSDTVCTFESQPVKCGDLNCPFSNYCLAEAAGFPPTSCIADSCPSPETTASACSREIDPYACLDGGLCYYDNGCLAGLAGQNTDPISGNCLPIVSIPPNPLSCPVVPVSTDCTFEYDPRTCGNDRCFYTNSCESTAAAFNEDDCTSTNCPVASADTVCTADFNPVLCGNLKCKYSNACVAEAAGYNVAAQCSLFSCPAVDPATCTREYKPTACGPDQCIYDNDCLASNAGFDLGQCTPLTDPTNPTECPVPEQTACTLNLDPMQCGTLGCRYDNPCLAEAAGFTMGSCWQADCPAPSTVDECGNEIDEGTCGPYDCLYGNRCLANRAGWQNSECSPVSCPVSSDTAACTYDYNPIVCNSNLVAGGITCSYSNACLAEAAGYTTEATAGQCIVPVVTEIASFAAAAVDTTSTGTANADPTPETNGEEAESAAPAAPAQLVVSTCSLVLVLSALVL